MRKVVFWLHLVTGAVAGVIVLAMSVTGVLLTYERQIVDMADSGFRSRPQSSRASMETVLENGERLGKGLPSSITLSADPVAPITLAFSRETNVYLDRYSAAVLGEGSQGVRKFFEAVTAWHRWLGAVGKNRETARSVTGAANLGFLFLLCTGILLWIPKDWTRRHLHPILFFRSGVSGKARDFNWHNVFGIWLVIPLLLIVASGVVMSYPWANNLVYRVAGTEPPRNSPMGNRPGVGNRPGRLPRAVRTAEGSLDRAIEEAMRRVEKWKFITLRLPGSKEDEIVLSVDQAPRGRPDLRLQMTADPNTGQVRKVENFEEAPAGRRARMWLRFIHTGEAAGFAGQTIAGMASFGGAILVWTGVSLAIRRALAWRRRRTLASEQQWEPATRA